MSRAEQQLRAISLLTAAQRRLIGGRNETDMDTEENLFGALVDAVRVFEDKGVSYALIGGLAVGIYSTEPRATGDVDIAVVTSVERSHVVSLLEDGGFTSTGEFEHSVNFRHGSGARLQVTFDPFFDEMVERADTHTVAGTALRVLRRDDLIATKERSARQPGRRRNKALRDEADVEQLRGDDPDPDEGW